MHHPLRFPRELSLYKVNFLQVICKEPVRILRPSPTAKRCAFEDFDNTFWMRRMQSSNAIKVVQLKRLTKYIAWRQDFKGVCGYVPLSYISFEKITSTSI